MTGENNGTNDNVIKIKNGKTIKTWVGLIVLFLSLYGGGIVAWTSLSKAVVDGEEDHIQLVAKLENETRRIEAEIQRVDIKHCENMAKFMLIGSDVSRRNSNIIVRQEETLEWLKKNVAQINSKIDRALTR